jgi:EPS-associated MarR family transcriptional regulator
MTSRQSLLQEDTRFRVLRLLHQQPHLSQRQLAERLGISLGAAHYCLNALIVKGQIKAQSFAGSQHKLHYVYLLTPAGIRQKAELTGRFLKRKLHEYEALKLEIKLLRQEAGAKLSEEGEPGSAAAINQRRLRSAR